MRLLDLIRCKLGRPRCHRELRNGIDFAMCNWCRRQSEVHEFGGPRPVPELPPSDLDGR